MHAIEAPQECALAATRRPDERGHHALGDFQIDVLKRTVGAVVKAEPLRTGLGRIAWGSFAMTIHVDGDTRRFVATSGCGISSSAHGGFHGFRPE